MTISQDEFNRKMDALDKANPEPLRKLMEAAHGAPLNVVHTDHRGNKSLGSHSDAWARHGRAYGDALIAAADAERLAKGAADGS